MGKTKLIYKNICKFNIFRTMTIDILMPERLLITCYKRSCMRNRTLGEHSQLFVQLIFFFAVFFVGTSLVYYGTLIYTIKSVWMGQIHGFLTHEVLGIFSVPTGVSHILAYISANSGPTEKCLTILKTSWTWLGRGRVKWAPEHTQWEYWASEVENLTCP